MHHLSLRRLVLAVSLFSAFPSLLMAQLQSVDAALAASRTTGKPVFAMAGSKT
jgi:hypothetical protein